MHLRPVALALTLVGCIASDDITQTAADEAVLAIQNNQRGSDLEERLARVERILGQAEDGSFADLATRVDTLEQQDLDARLTAVEALVARVDALETTASGLDTRLTTLEGTVGTQGTSLGTLRGEVDGLTTAVGELRDDVGTLEADEDPLADQTRALHAWRTETVTPTLADFETRVGDIESSYASVAYVDAEITATELYCDDAVDVLDDSLPDVIATDTTWTVDGVGGTSTTFATPAAAVEAAQDVRIAPDAVLTIEIDDGTYTATSPLEVRHPDGAQLEIVGNTSDPSRVVLRFEGSDGIVVEDGHVLGLLDGVTLQGDGGGTERDGIRVLAGSVWLGTAMVIDGFSGDGLLVAERGFVHGEDLETRDNGSDGVEVDQQSIVVAPGLVTTGNGRNGIYAGNNSTIVVDGIVAERNGSTGVSVEAGGMARADRGRSRSNGAIGFFAGFASGITADETTSSSNGQQGYRALQFSAISANRSTCTGNVNRAGYRAGAMSYIAAGGAVNSGNGAPWYLSTNTVMNANSFIQN